LASKAVKMAKTSAKGGFNLFWGLATSTIISAIGGILVARLLSPSEYGIAAIAMVAPNLITILIDWSIKFCTQCKSKNDS